MPSPTNAHKSAARKYQRKFGGTYPAALRATELPSPDPSLREVPQSAGGRTKPFPYLAVSPVDGEVFTVAGSAPEGAIELINAHGARHTSIIGKVGSGKTHTVRTLLHGLTSATAPSQVRVVQSDDIVFPLFSGEPHVLVSVSGEHTADTYRDIRRSREAYLHAAGVRDYMEYLNRDTPEVAGYRNEWMPFLLFVIDHRVDAYDSSPETAMHIGATGRSLGVGLIVTALSDHILRSVIPNTTTLLRTTTDGMRSWSLEVSDQMSDTRSSFNVG